MDRNALCGALGTLEIFMGDRRSDDRLVEVIFTMDEAKALVTVCRHALAADGAARAGGDGRAAGGGGEGADD